MSLLPDFMLLALLGGIGLAIISAPLGVFMVWQRQSYFGATLAHSALLGISIGLYLHLDLTLSVIVVSMIVAAGIFGLGQYKQLSSDTLLGILAHSSLAFGLILISLQDNIQVDLMGYLFGDILSINTVDLTLILFTSLLILVFYIKHWQSLLNVTLNPELAQVEGVNVKQVQLLFVLLLAFMIALSMKIVGVLLVTSLLIIPAAAARKLSNSPEQMLVISIFIGIFSIVAGLITSYYIDVPTGPAIVMAATVVFLLLQLKPQSTR
ncbi:iron chelate uptake ABC transporter family permease subunit [Thiomicrorhabdus lithotrophica]|uniref:High-affinity zinc uptake system membrane protein ZnuB n=1 Tax=Thiomicrorhabdus lithotrophica TaxID=2949997 RepID=A0ABY8C7V3_9GAMM|nr:iron chelate uptake ABC transporter family permease subunit [Thiomicrorhabdus lithotrophica]WEJ62039.1 metal ABC transporter permease [Thiomicrorhabdus lithotrophica]